MGTVTLVRTDICKSCMPCSLITTKVSRYVTGRRLSLRFPTLQASERKCARAAENMMLRMRFPGSSCTFNKKWKGVAQVAPSLSVRDFCSISDWTGLLQRTVTGVGHPQTLSQLSHALPSTHSRLLSIHALVRSRTCYVFMSISTSQSFPSSSSALSHIPSSRPSQIKFFRPAQMALFAKIVTHPPLAQASIIPPSRKEVSLGSWQCLHLHHPPAAPHSVCSG